MSTALSIQQELKRFVVENFLFGADDRFGGDDSFLEKGILDSTGMLELIVHLEKTYGIKVEDAELVPENLDSLNRLVAFIERKSVTAQERRHASAS